MISTLKTLCTMSREETEQYLIDRGFALQGRNLIYGENDNCPLIVCHRDTVADHSGCRPTITIEGDTITSIALDDRLGIAMMLEMIAAGIRCNYLVTDDEEIGKTTAANYRPTFTPTMLVELDRRGYDCVTYDYRSADWLECLQAEGFTIGSGSFSDICQLEHLNVSGVNFGIGYAREHTDQCNCNLNLVSNRLEEVIYFINRHGQTTWPHEDNSFAESVRDNDEYTELMRMVDDHYFGFIDELELGHTAAEYGYTLQEIRELLKEVNYGR